ncbi:MAG: cbb3-type cytochrome c oxidase subunit I [bacterium]|nr:cbb3-type cytochrome c oxidase subunit I [bacterium]
MTRAEGGFNLAIFRSGSHGRPFVSGAPGGSALSTTKNNRTASPISRVGRYAAWSDGLAADTAAKWHIIASTAFLAAAGIVWVAGMVELRFPGTLTGPFSYGRIRPIALLLAVIGWLTLSMAGGVYYILPRLTGVRMRGEALALAGGAATAGVTVVGALVVLLGGGDGTGPFSLPWWVSLPLLATLLAPMAVTVSTVRHRQEPNIFVSLWYALAGVVWLPLLYLVGAVPPPSAMGGAMSESVSLFGLSNLWVVGMGIGLAYYALVKETGNPLASRQLARVGFWSLAFASAWGGAGPLVFGPVPDWLEAVAFLMTLALPVSALANAANLSLTTEEVWAERHDRPVVAAALGGAFFALFTAALTSFGTVRSAAAVVGLTPFWDGVLYATLFGTGGLLVAAWSYQALPSITGRILASQGLARLHLRLTFWGVGLTSALLVGAGLVAGYGWAGGSFGGISPTGEGWGDLVGLASLLLGLSILSGLVTLLGQFSFCLAVLRTFTSGRPATQEVFTLVPADGSSEEEEEDPSETGEEE